MIEQLNVDMMYARQDRERECRELRDSRPGNDIVLSPYIWITLPSGPGQRGQGLQSMDEGAFKQVNPPTCSRHLAETSHVDQRII